LILCLLAHPRTGWLSGSKDENRDRGRSREREREGYRKRINLFFCRDSSTIQISQHLQGINDSVSVKRFVARDVVDHDQSVEPGEILQKLHLSDQIEIILLDIQVGQIAGILQWGETRDMIVRNTKNREGWEILKTVESS
jgi:hypothetical protein